METPDFVLNKLRLALNRAKADLAALNSTFMKVKNFSTLSWNELSH